MFYFLRGLITFVVALGGFYALTYARLGDQGAVTLGYLIGLIAFLAAVGGWHAFQSWLGAQEEPVVHDWTRFFRFTTDHKVVGVQYLVATFVIFVVAGLMALVMRAELAQPGMQFINTDQYNTVMGLHGMGMVVVALVGIVGGLGNFLVPLMIGAEDMAFPRLNALSFWLVPPAVILLLSTPFFGGFDFGWTAYPPLAVRGPLGKLIFVLAFVTAGFSSIFGGVNFLTTIAQLRTKGMRYFRMPIFVWSIVAASIIIVLATSVVASGLLMIVFDRVLHTSFFNPNQGGNVLLYQHLFWYYSHPAVYIMALPAFGLMLEVLPVFARKPLFAYSITAVSYIVIVAISFIVWAHHMFTSGMWQLLNFPFMLTTELISIPTGVVFLSALGTLWRGKLRMRAPMLWAMGIVFNFLVGGLTGIFLADVPTDLHMQDTWFVVAHFHFTIVGSAVMALFTGIYFWFPKITGKMYSETLAKVHFWLFVAGFNLTFIPMFWLGAHGMRRRVADYPEWMGHTQLFISCASLLIAVSVAIFLYNIIRSWISGAAASGNPWEAKSLEWTVSSPPPHTNFTHPPVVDGHPYRYGTPAD